MSSYKKTSYCFLNDRPTNHDDIGSHQTIAEKIYQIIHSNIKRPFVFGLFGEWGVGKSSIIEMLQKESLKNRETKIIVVDAWRKHKDTFLRQFIKKLAFELLDKDSAQKVEKNVNIKKIEHQNKWQPTKEANWVFGLFMCLVIIIILSPLLILYLNSEWNLKISYDYPVDKLSTIFLTVFIASFFQFLLPKYSIKTDIAEQDMTLHDITFFRKVYFQDIISQAKFRTICIVIDNLDRINADDAQSIIRIIKTFIVDAGDATQSANNSVSSSGLDKVVFLLPCDDKALQKNIFNNSQEKDSYEFLRKFFNVSLRIPSFESSDCYQYTRGLLESTELKLTETQKDKISYVISSLCGSNPRQPKIFINNFIARYITAETFEDKGQLQKGVVTDHPEWFAVYVALDSHFSNIDIPDSIEELKSRTDDEENKAEIGFLKKVNLIINSITPEAWMAYYYLKKPNDYLLIDGFADLEEAALKGTEDFPGKLKKIQDNHKNISALLWDKGGQERKIKIMQSVLNAKKILPEIEIANRVSDEIAGLIKDRINDMPKLPAEIVYNGILKPRVQTLIGVLYNIYKKDISNLSPELFKEQGSRRFQLELVKEILGDIQMPPEISKYLPDLLNFIATYSDELVVSAVNNGNYFSQNILNQAVSLFGSSKMEVSPGKLIDYCNCPLNNQRREVFGQITNMLYSSMTSDKFNISYLCDAIKKIKPIIIEHNITTAPIINIINKLGQKYHSTENWRERYVIITTLNYMTDFGSYTQFANTARQLVVGLGGHFIMDPRNDMLLEFLAIEKDIIKQYFVAKLPIVANVSKEVCFAVLKNYSQSIREVVMGVFSQNRSWILEWIDSISEDLDAEARMIQPVLLEVSAENGFPLEIYSKLKMIKTSSQTELIEGRIGHFENLIASKSVINNIEKLRFILERIVAANYSCTKSQKEALDTAITKIEGIVEKSDEELIQKFRKIKVLK